DPAATDVLAAVHERTDGLGAEVVFEAVGLSATMEQAIELAAPGSTVLIAGVADRDEQASFRPQELFFKELTIRGTKGVTWGVDRALRWLGRLDLEPLITHTLPLARAQEAVELALHADSGKVMLAPRAVEG